MVEGDLFRRAREIFLEARGADPAEREAFLERICAGEPALRREVESLLEHDSQAAGFLVGRALDGLATPPPGSLSHPERIGNYRVQRLLGVGAMGLVYLAEQESPRRLVALKLLRADVASAGLVLRFKREARVLARLSHAGIAKVYEAGVEESEHGSRPWFAMEHVDGPSLIEYVEKRGLPVRERLDLFLQICSAVQHAHEQGVVHRDLKPSNLLVDGSGHPKVLDFGVARWIDEAATEGSRHTRTGQLLGTPAYMSPEQAGGEASSLDARADVYSLGVVLFELLTGRLPLEVRDVPLTQALRTIQEDEPTSLGRVRPDLRGDLDTITGKALEKQRERRYASVSELAADVANHLQRRPIVARRASRAQQAGKLLRRQPGLVVSVLTLILALLAVTVVMYTSNRRSRIQLERTSTRLEAMAQAVLDLAPNLGFGEDQREGLQRVLGYIEKQLEDDPRNAALQGAQADVLAELGSLDQTRGDLAVAFDRFQVARSIREQMTRRDPSDLESWTQLSRLCAKLGETQDRGEAAAEVWFRKALELDERLVREHPGDDELLEDLGWSLERVAALGRVDREEARRLMTRRLADALEMVQRHPNEWKYLFNAAMAHSQESGFLYRQGSHELSTEHLLQVVPLVRTLCELQPRRRDFLVYRVRSWIGLGGQLLGQGRFEEARSYAREGQRYALQLLAGDLERTEYAELVLTACELAYDIERSSKSPDPWRPASEGLLVGAQILEFSTAALRAPLFRALADVFRAWGRERDLDGATREVLASAFVDPRATPGDQKLVLSVVEQRKGLRRELCLDVLRRDRESGRELVGRLLAFEPTAPDLLDLPWDPPAAER